jgi:hypothetical protein
MAGAVVPAIVEFRVTSLEPLFLTVPSMFELLENQNYNN